jgi:hypothetical protein
MKVVVHGRRKMNYPEKITHQELIEMGRDLLIKPYANSAIFGHSGCCVVITDISTSECETPDALGFCSRGSIVIECKMSLADFRADQKKQFRKHQSIGVGYQRWYMAPEGIIPHDKIPPKWGLLEVTPGRRILVTIKSELHKNNKSSEITILLSLLRRLNIQPDGHVAIKKYEIVSDKNKATFYVDP